MTSRPASVLPTSKPERLYGLEDEDFDQWLATIPATDTASLFAGYRKYASEAIAKDVEIVTFNEWRSHLGDRS